MNKYTEQQKLKWEILKNMSEVVKNIYIDGKLQWVLLDAIRAYYKDEETQTESAAPEKKAPEKKAPEKKAPEKKAPEKKAPEKKAPEKKVEDFPYAELSHTLLSLAKEGSEGANKAKEIIKTHAIVSEGERLNAKLIPVASRKQAYDDAVAAIAELQG